MEGGRPAKRSRTEPPPPAREPLVSVCVPVHNCAPFLDECLASVLAQSCPDPLEVSLFDDGSDDGSSAKIAGWAERFRDAGWRWVAARGETNRGEGYARNRAVRQSHGEYICVMDGDDIMHPSRVERQLAAARRHPEAIVGGGFRREPEDATWHYTAWANALSQRELLLQQYRECTLLHPTWFHTRALFDALGGYVETADGADEARDRGRPEPAGSAPPGGRVAKKLAKAEASVAGFERHCAAGEKGWDEATRRAKQQQLARLRQKRDVLSAAAAAAAPASGVGAACEDGAAGDLAAVPAVAVDLRLFHSHLDHFYARKGAAEGGSAAGAVALLRCEGEPVLTYRHRPGQSMCTHTSRKTLLRLRLRAFERRILRQPRWQKFTIWGAGRDGRNFFAELQPEFRSQVRGFCDIDPAKIARGFSSPALPGATLPVVRWEEVEPPFVVCVAMGRTGGELERNVASRGLVEGVDYWHFS